MSFGCVDCGQAHCVCSDDVRKQRASGMSFKTLDDVLREDMARPEHVWGDPVTRDFQTGEIRRAHVGDERSLIWVFGYDQEPITDREVV